MRHEARSVVAVEPIGPYSLVRVDRGGLDPGAPGQFFMLRPPGHVLPRPMSLCQAPPGELAFLVDAVGPGTAALASLAPGERVDVFGPLGRGFRLDVERPLLVGGGIGIAPLAIWRSQLARMGVPTRVLLGFRDRAHSGGLDLFDCSELRLASEDGHAGHRGLVTDLLSVLLEGDDAASAAVYACGPPAMLEAVRAMGAERGMATQLAMEAPMACGFGACMGCAVPLAEGGYMRLCVDGPVVDASQIETALVPGSGH